MDKEVFVQNIRYLCEAKGVKPTVACRESGVGASFINNIEGRKQTPSVEKVQQLAQYLGVTTSVLLGEETIRAGGGVNWASKPRFVFDEPAEDDPEGYRESVRQLLEENPNARTEKRGQVRRYSDAAMRLARDYDEKLDHWGRTALRELADHEIARCEDEARFEAETTLKPEPKVIPLYRSPAAAGLAAPVFGEDFDYHELSEEDPQGAEFAVRLQGDSMEPDFPDGSIVFCNRDPMADGDIGVFYVDGGSVCKQYHKQGGVVYLFSLNRKRQDADVVLLPSGNRPFLCQGRVMTRKRYPIPGWER